MMNDQHEAEGSGFKDATVLLTDRQKNLAICSDIVALYKKLIASDEPEFQKLIREMTKCFVTAGTVSRKLNRLK